MTRQDAGVPTAEKKTVHLMTHNAYGKSRVRLTKVTREKDMHVLHEIAVAIQLEGKFERSYTEGDNTEVVATDSMKNTVYVLAAEHPLKDIESFGKTLAKHFLDSYESVSKVTVQLEEELWHRIEVDGKPHANSFYGAGAEKHTARITATKDKVDVVSGIAGLKLVKTTDSEFWGFVRDRYTTLVDVKDRIFGTSVEAIWQYTKDGVDYKKSYDTIRATILEIFATHHSLAVQHTLYDIGQISLDRAPDVSEITITMPNEHRIPFNLEPFGLTNKDEVFVATAEPFGLISGTLKRNQG
ncbi:urate oxidase [Candidatus Obscuribacterales bacterium]|nr:urate oxidase [Candidatus Obscuribacterales bacterium]